jgi:hypothetical protein
MRATSELLRLALRFSAIVLLTIPLAICFQIVGMLLTGWGTQGFAWLAIGVLWLPTVLASCIYLIELRNLRQAILRGSAMGLLASISLLLLGLAIIMAAGPMDGGI